MYWFAYVGVLPTFINFIILYKAIYIYLQERLQLEEKMRKQEMEIDYLAPFLSQIGDPEKLTRKQACQLKEDCLADLKQRLIDKANLIQARFEKVKIDFSYMH